MFGANRKANLIVNMSTQHREFDNTDINQDKEYNFSFSPDLKLSLDTKFNNKLSIINI